MHAYKKPKKNVILLTRKNVIDYLKDRRMKFGELKTKTELSESTLSRVLKELKTLGLIKKTNGYWTWYTYKKKYKPEMLPLASEHAKRLALGFEAVLPFHVQTRYVVGDNYVPKEKVSQLKKYALAHIRTGYPTIDNTLTQFRNLKSELDKIQTKETSKFVNKLEREGKTRKVIFTLGWKKEPARSWFRKLFPKAHLHIESKNAYLLGPFETEEELRGIMEKHDMVVHGFHRAEDGAWFMEGPIYLGKVEVANFLKMREALMTVYEELSGQIGKLLLQIEWGHPLDGECGLCSEIAFADVA